MSGNCYLHSPDGSFLRLNDNIRSIEEGHVKRKPDLSPYRSVDDPTFKVRLRSESDDKKGYLHSKFLRNVSF